MLGQFFGIADSILGGLLQAYFPYSQNFALSFAVAAFGTWLSLFFLTRVHEPTLSVQTPPHAKGQYGVRLLQILRSNANFRTYLISRWFSHLVTMTTGFVAVYSVE